MAGNAALDIVIGLVFIYLLYSLYATVIMELIASILGLRARNLSYALRRMLMEEKDFEKAPLQGFFVRLLSTFSRLFGRAINQKNPGLFYKFFEQPTIKFLTSGGLGNTPSYISAENFTKALIDAIKIDNLDAGALVAIEKGLLESKLAEENPQTQGHLLSLLKEANNDVEKFKILVEKWYNDTMERASGWYKQTTQSLLIIIGLLLAFSFNVDTLSIIRKLSKDEEARTQLVNLAVEFSKRTPPLTTPDGSSPVPDTSASSKAALEALQASKAALEADIKNSQSILSSAWDIPDSLKYYENALEAKDVEKGLVKISYKLKGGNKDVYSYVSPSLDTTTLKSALKLSCFTHINKNSVTAASAPKHDGFVEVSISGYKWSHFLKNFWGYILTVLALSLGAPFWFDLLNKLIKLRSSKALSGEEAGEKADVTQVKNAKLRRAG